MTPFLNGAKVYPSWLPRLTEGLRTKPEVRVKSSGNVPVAYNDFEFVCIIHTTSPVTLLNLKVWFDCIERFSSLVTAYNF